jgi:hypothetical protein
MKSRWSRETSANFDLDHIKLDSPWLIPLSVRFVLTSTVIAYNAWPHEVVRFGDPLTEIVQDFAIGPSRDVCALAFMPTLDLSRRVGSLRVEVQRPRGHAVASSTLPLQQLRDREWNFVRFPEVDLAGAYSLVLSTSPDMQARLGVLTSNGDTQAGDLVVSGKRVDGDLALRLDHCNPALPQHWRVAREGTGTLLLENTKAGPGAVLLDASAWDAEPSTDSFDVEHVVLSQHRADHRAYDVIAQTPSFLVASIRDLEGWSATVDGVPREVRAYRGFLVSVAVPPGPHRVELRYAPPREGRYLFVSFAALLACVLLVRRRSVAPPTR